jgi:hypothetical protein
MAEKREVRHRLIHEIGVISVNPSSGWKKELNILAWNDNPAKYDIRDWSSDRKHLSKGVTLSERDMETLVGLYTTYKGNLEEAESSERKEPQKTQAANAPDTSEVPVPPEVAEAQESPAEEAEASTPF